MILNSEENGGTVMSLGILVPTLRLNGRSNLAGFGSRSCLTWAARGTLFVDDGCTFSSRLEEAELDWRLLEIDKMPVLPSDCRCIATVFFL